MANGFHGPKADWDRMAQPLTRLDPVLQEFGSRRGLEVQAGGKWPDRCFRWDSPIRRLIQIFVDEESVPTYKIWICAYEDRPLGRYWRQETLLAGGTADDLSARLTDILESAFESVSSWNSPDLELAR